MASAGMEPRHTRDRDCDARLEENRDSRTAGGRASSAGGFIFTAVKPQHRDLKEPTRRLFADSATSQFSQPSLIWGVRSTPHTRNETRGVLTQIVPKTGPVAPPSAAREALVL
jgi:hypothetical protein